MNLLKNLFKKLINSFKIPTLIGTPKPAAENWERLGLEKFWKLFFSVFLVIILAIKSYLFNFIVTAKSRIDVINYQGDSSPLSIVYKANAIIAIGDQIFNFIAYFLICYFTYSFFKQKD